MNALWASDRYNEQKIAILDHGRSKGLSCGVNWFATHSEPTSFAPRTSQARTTFRALFPVESIEDYAAAFVSSGLVDRSFSEMVPVGVAERTEWIHRSLATLAGCELVLLDPDTGITGQRPTVKHVGALEVEVFARRAHVMVYQHASREPASRRRARLVKVLAAASIPPARVRFLRYRAIGGAELVLVGSAASDLHNLVDGLPASFQSDEQPGAA